jgi:CRP-like cAMP-binding protein
MTNIWYHFKRAGITIPFPIRDVTLRQIDEKAETRAAEDRRARVRAYFEDVDLLAALSKNERNKLAAGAAERRYAAGERIVRQGDPGSEFFIVVSGKVRVTVRREKGRAVDLGTFEPRRATITATEDTDVVVVGKGGFQEIIAAHPKIANKLSSAIEKRRTDIEREFAEAGDADAAATVEKEYSRENVLKKIKTFFDIE